MKNEIVFVFSKISIFSLLEKENVKKIGKFFFFKK